MGFRFRRSIKVIPGIRLNISKSGPSLSLGTRGFRHTIGPKGSRTTVGIPSTGLSWTEHTPHKSPATPSKSQFVPITPNEPIATNATALTPIQSASAEKVGALSTGEFAPILNSACQRPGIAPWVAIFSAGYFFIAFGSGNQNWIMLSIVYAFIFILGAMTLDRYRRSIRIEYVLQGTAKAVAQTLYETFKDLRNCNAVWKIGAQGSTTDWKRNAGATSLVQRKRIHPKFGRPIHIRGQVSFPMFCLSDNTIYFAPDTILVEGRGSIAAVSYKEFFVSVSSTNFIEDEAVPSDASVIGHTWRYVNKRGDPDRRFNGNRQLPICVYGEMIVHSKSGLNYKIQYSNKSACNRFRKALDILRRPESLLREKPITSFKKAKSWPSIVFFSSFVVALFVPIVLFDNSSLIDGLRQQGDASKLQVASKPHDGPIATGSVVGMRPKQNARQASAPLDILPKVASDSRGSTVPLPRKRPFQ